MPLARALIAGGVTVLEVTLRTKCALATTSEVMVFLERGLGHGKFFPAQPAGGIAYLKALTGPITDFRFCPTGGIDLAGAPDFLALPNVACVGGSTIT